MRRSNRVAGENHRRQPDCFALRARNDVYCVPLHAPSPYSPSPNRIPAMNCRPLLSGEKK
jgi:hypothetical protein